MYRETKPPVVVRQGRFFRQERVLQPHVASGARTTARALLWATLTVCFLLSCGACSSSSSQGMDQSPRIPAGYESFSDAEIGVSVVKPVGWQVYAHQGTITLKPSCDSRRAVFVHPVFKVAPGADALTFLRNLCDHLVSERPDTVVQSRRTSRDGSLGLLTVTYRDPQDGARLRALYLVNKSGDKGLLSGYQSPAGEFDREGSTFRTVLASLRVESAAFHRTTMRNTAYSSDVHPSITSTINTENLQIKSSTDGTMYLAVPPNWTVNGGNYSLIAVSPDGKMGVTATHDHQPRTFDLRSYLLDHLIPFYGCTGTKISSAQRDEEFIRSQSYLGLPTDARRFEGSTTNGDGLRVRFGILVYATRTVGNSGYVGTLGIYAAPELYDRDRDVLACMALSMQPDREKCMARLRKNLAGLAAASATMSQSNDVVAEAIRTGTANINRAIDKYNYYLSGEEARYSPTENRIFVVDSHLAEYAMNPRYPQEVLVDVPDHLWDQLPHERD